MFLIQQIYCNLFIFYLRPKQTDSRNVRQQSYLSVSTFTASRFIVNITNSASKIFLLRSTHSSGFVQLGLSALGYESIKIQSLKKNDNLSLRLLNFNLLTDRCTVFGLFLRLPCSTFSPNSLSLDAHYDRER